MAILNEFITGLSTGYKTLISELPPEISSIVNVFIFAVVIAVYSIFTWKFYRFLSKKDLIGLNLSKYNTTTHAGSKKFFGFLLYLLEYVIAMPFLIFFWFTVLALVIFVLAEEQTAIQVLTLSAAMVAAIRILSYYQEDLSRDLAKMFPLTILITFILTPNFFSMERVLLSLAEIPQLFVNVIYFLVLIALVEIIFRFLDVITGGLSDSEGKEDNEGW